MHGGVYSRMAEEFLHLLYWHSLVDSTGGECASELVGMDPLKEQPPSHFAQARFDASDGQPFMLSMEADEQRRVAVMA